MKEEVFEESNNIKLSNASAITVDDKGNAYVCDYNKDRIVKISAVDGELSCYWKEKTELYCPEELLWCKNGDILVAQHRSSVIRISKEGDVSVFLPAPVGYKDGTLQEAKFGYIRGMVEDDDRNIFVTDFYNQAIRKIDVSRGIISTIAGAIETEKAILMAM